MPRGARRRPIRLARFGDSVKRIVFVILNERLRQPCERDRLPRDASGVLVEIDVAVRIAFAVIVIDLPETGIGRRRSERHLSHLMSFVEFRDLPAAASDLEFVDHSPGGVGEVRGKGPEPELRRRFAADRQTSANYGPCVLPIGIPSSSLSLSERLEMFFILEKSIRANQTLVVTSKSTIPLTTRSSLAPELSSSSL